MYVCVCNAVTDRQIHEAVQQGATTVKHLKDTLGVAKDCASCVGCAKACIKQAKSDNKASVVQSLIQFPNALAPSL